MITIDDFAKVEIRVGTVIEVGEVEGSEKLLKLKVDFGEEGTRQVLTGIKAWFKPEDLLNGQYTFVFNLEPRKMMGLDSEAMIMAAEGEDGTPAPLIPSKPSKNGSKIK